MLCPDAESCMATWYMLTGYGRDDGSAPTDIRVTNLDGDLIEPKRGLAEMYAMGTYTRKY